MELPKLAAGLVILLISGKYLVSSAVSLAQHLKVSRLVIGVTVVSFGTSAPELLVSLQAAIGGHPDISMGNVIGSNISNIALVLAISAIIYPIAVRSYSIKVDWPIMILAFVLLYVFSLDFNLGRIEGIIFLALLTGFIVFTIRNSRKKDQQLLLEEITDESMALWPALIILVVSAGGLAFGSHWLVEGAAVLARDLGISERVISITLIAFGTSIPELATSGIAAFKREADISIGNIIGSNIFNIFAVLGITSIITPIHVNEILVQVDIFWMLGISVLLFLFILPLKGGILKRWKGGLLFLTYLCYLYFLFF
ncbi:MAG: calcium/sodium antiporter [Bacteroidota bacterium]